MRFRVYTDHQKYVLVYDGDRSRALAICGDDDFFNIHTGIRVAIQKFLIGQFATELPSISLDYTGAVSITELTARAIQERLPKLLRDGYTLDELAPFVSFKWLME